MRVGREQCKGKGRHVLHIKKKWWEGENEQSKDRVRDRDGEIQSKRQTGMIKAGWKQSARQAGVVRKVCVSLDGPCQWPRPPLAHPAPSAHN